MTDFFKSAFNNIFSNQSGPNTSAASSSNTSTFNEFIGQNIQINSYRFKVIKQLAEGGYAIVYVIQDVTNSQEYALKRMFSADKTSTQTIHDEISYLKKLSSHSNIVKFVAAACEEKDQNKKEFLVVTELCKGGSLIDYLRQVDQLEFDQILKIFYQMCKAVQHLHSQIPSIIHRDIKIENFLISNDLILKLCDFGSASIQQYYPDHTWSANKRNLVEDELAKHTTPMYRPPEMLDLYSNYPIDKQSDIWALGCILYVLCYGKHPFEDSAKLRIINGNYTIPQNSTHLSEFNDIIRCMFNLDPRSRPPIDEIVFHLENIASTKSISLTDRLDFLSSTLKSFSPTPQQIFSSQTSTNEAQKWIGNATNLFKSGFKTVKEASTKVIDQVVQQTISGKIDFDICELTSRIVVIPNATLEGLESDIVREQLLDRKPFHCVYNFTTKSYRKEKFCKIIDINGLTSKKAPQMSLLLKLCANIYKYLNDNPKNIVILHDNDGKSLSALITSSLFIFTGCFDQLDSPLSLFAIKRSGHNLSQSQLRYLNYVLQLSTDSSFLPLKNELNLNTLTMSSIPMFNRSKNGCTPYIEIYMKDQRIFTNYQEYDLLKKFTLSDGKINVNVNCRLYGDITIILYHARSLLGTGKATSTKIAQLQFHTGFLDDQNRVVFKKSDLDELDTADKYTDSFSVILELTRFNDSSIANDEAWNVTNLNDYKNRRIIFSSNDEMNEVFNVYGKASASKYSDFDSNGTQVGQSTFFTEPVTEEFEAFISEDDQTEDPKKSDLKNEQPVGNLLDFDDNTSSAAQPSANTNQIRVESTQDAFDLLNLGETTSTTSKNTNQNIFGDFDFLNASSQPTQKSTQSSSDFDLLGFSNPTYSSASKPNPSRQTITTQNQQPQQQQASKPTFRDPFEDLANLSFPQNTTQQSNLLGASVQTQKSNASLRNSPLPTQNPNYYFNTTTQSQQQQQQQQQKQTPPQQPKRSNFDEFLPSDFGKSTTDSKKSIKDIQKSQNSANVDPDKARVEEWVEGKRKNIRALLCTMDKVLWEGYQTDGTKWKPIGMHEVVTADQVKKWWKKAVLAVHPDKLTDHPQINLARLIYIELNAAMKQFEAEGQQNLF